MSKEFNAKLDLLIKSEKALLKLEMRKRARQTLLVSIALLAILVALLMANVAIYLFLERHYSPMLSAALLSGLNLVVAILFFLLASKGNRSEERESIEEIRDYAWGQVSADINGIKQQVIEFSDGVNRVRSSVDTVINKEFFGLKNVVPILQTLIQMKRASSKTEDPE